MLAFYGLHVIVFPCQVHGREVKVTHQNHLRQAVPVDYVWWRAVDTPSAATAASDGSSGPRSVFLPQQAYLLPTELDDSVWHADYELSDHRPLVSIFRPTAAVVIPSAPSPAPAVSAAPHPCPKCGELLACQPPEFLPRAML